MDTGQAGDPRQDRDDNADRSADVRTVRNELPVMSNMVQRFVAARLGSSAALGELFENCRNYLLLIANLGIRQGLQDKVGASDLVQDTFLEAQRCFGRFEGETEEELLRWLTRILEYRLLNTRKRYYRTARRNVGRELAPHQFFSDSMISGLPDASGKSPSAVCCGKEDQERYLLALSSLPADEQSVIRLRVDEDLAFEEVGHRLNRSAEAARKLFARAVVRLQEKLDLNHDHRNGTE